MSRGQRFTFLAIAVVIAIVAVVVLADSSEDDTSTESSATTTPTATATASPTEAEPGEEETPTATSTPTPTPPPPPLLTAGRVRELEFTEGERIRFRVRSDVPEEIHVHCYDITRDVPGGDTITVSFEASITGTCEVEFHNSGEQIASLTVRPG
jgi:hypothetical protein